MTTKKSKSARWFTRTMLCLLAFAAGCQTRQPQSPSMGNSAEPTFSELQPSENTESVTLLSRKARMYYSIGRMKDSTELWQRVLQKEPNNAEARSALRNINGADPRRKAEELSRQALKYYGNGDRDLAIAYWKKSLAVDPNNVRVKNNIERVENEIAARSSAR